MKNIVEEWLEEIGCISELQECLLDVFENSMYKNKQPFYSLILQEQIKNRINLLYDKIDNYCSKSNND